jgi:hypothetical protein
MMTNSSIDTSAARLSSGYISSAGEALDIVSSVQFLLADNIRSSLSSQLSTGDGLIEKILAVSDLLGRVKDSTSGPFSLVTVETLKNSARNTDDLSKLFLKDGPRLGNSISEGQAILDDLLGLGAGVEVKILYPFLTEIKDSGGKLTSSQFQWLTQAQLNNILGGQLTPLDSDFPGAVSFSKKTDSSSTTYTSFESYGIMRPELLTINAAFSKIRDVVDGYRNELLGLVANTARAASQLESMIDRAIESGKTLGVKKTENDEKNKADLIEILRKIYILKIEKFTKDDLKFDPEISRQVSGKVELQTYPEMTARVSEKSDFKTDPVIPTKASENSANPDK